MSRLSIEQRARIISCLSSGESTRSIADAEGVSQSAVAKISKRKHLMVNFKDLPRSGRPRIFSERGERQIVRDIVSGSADTAVEVQARLCTSDKIDVSVQSIRRVLQRNGLSARIKRKKPLLQRKHRLQRLSFAKKYQSWSVNDWKKGCVV
jgi:transposase